MRLCLRCRSWSPRGARYCLRGCGAFVGTLCEHGHLSPGLAAVARCPTCHTRNLVQATPSVNFGWTPRLLAWGCALLAIKFTLTHLGTILAWAVNGVGFVVGQEALQVVGSLISLLLALKVFAFCVRLVNTELGERLDLFPGVLRWIWSALLKTLGWLWKALVRLIEGPPPAPAKPKTTSPKGRSTPDDRDYGDSGMPLSYEVHHPTPTQITEISEILAACEDSGDEA